MHPEINLLPIPKHIRQTEGVFRINHKTRIVLAPDMRNILTAKELQKAVSRHTGLRLEYERTLQLKEGETNQIIFRLDPSLGREEYQICVTPELVTVTGADEAACFLGLQTVKQLLTQFACLLPCLEITDCPDTPNRVFYYDCGRNKVPTLETMKKIVDKCVQYKYNQIQFYTEHAFRFSGMSEVWCSIDALTKEMILQLDQYCRERYIELVPSIPTFGHLYDILSTESFGYLCELDDYRRGPGYWPEKSKHHTINASDPRALQLVLRMLDETIPLFSSNKFNICGDETFDLGRGKNKGKDTGVLYVDFICKIIDHLKQHGKTVMMWADVIGKHPDLIYRLPKDVVMLNWTYEAKNVETCAQRTKDSGYQQYATCSCSACHRLYPSMETSYENIYAWSEASTRYGYQGLILSNWGDWGHLSPFDLSVPMVVYAGSLFWHHDETLRDKALFNRLASRVEYGDYQHEFVQLLYDISVTPKMIWHSLRFWIERHLDRFDEENLSYFWVPYHTDDRIPPLNGEELQADYEKLLAMGAQVLCCRINPESFGDKENIYTAVIGLALTTAFTQILKRYAYHQEVQLILPPRQLAEELEIWLDNTQRCWRKDFQPSEFWYNLRAVKEICTYLRSLEPAV